MRVNLGEKWGFEGESEEEWQGEMELDWEKLGENGGELGGEWREIGGIMGGNRE